MKGKESVMEKEEENVRNRVVRERREKRVRV
jgi:hypothetical protein